MVLFFGSIIFYAMGAGRMAILLTALTIVNYILGQMVFSADKGGVKASNKRAFYLATSDLRSGRERSPPRPSATASSSLSWDLE